MLSHLAHARFQDPEHGERPLTDGEIINLIDHLFIGGNETTTFAITSGLWLLTSHPEVERRLRDDPARILDLRRGGAAARVTDAGAVAGSGARRGGRRGGDPGRARRSTSATPPPTAIAADVPRAGRARPRAVATPPATSPSAPASTAARARACPGWSSASPFELFLQRMSNLRFTPEKNDFTHLPGFVLRALKELHVSYEPIRA